MQKYAAVAVFCLCVGLAYAQAPTCPPGLVCLTKEEAASIVARFNEMAAIAEQAVTLLEEQQKIIERLKKSTNCS